MSNVHILKNPFLQEYVGLLRDKNTTVSRFTWVLKHIGGDIIYEITKNECTMRKVSVTTPIGEAEGEHINESFVLIAILRAAMPLVYGALEKLDGVENLIRSWGIVDAKRLESGDLTADLKNQRAPKMNVKYTAWKVPDTNGKTIAIVFDPMLATGSTVSHVLWRLKKEYKYEKLVSASIFASKLMLGKLAEEHPDVSFYTCAVDEGGINGTGLNKDGYIVPGCGDCGDRTANTPSL